MFRRTMFKRRTVLLFAALAAGFFGSKYGFSQPPAPAPGTEEATAAATAPPDTAESTPPTLPARMTPDPSKEGSPVSLRCDILFALRFSGSS